MKNARCLLHQAVACGFAACGAMGFASVAQAEATTSNAKPAIISPNMSVAGLVGCASPEMPSVVQSNALLTNARVQKSAAILSGEMSALERMRAEQNAQETQLALGSAVPALGSLAPAAGNVRQSNAACPLANHLYLSSPSLTIAKPASTSSSLPSTITLSDLSNLVSTSNVAKFATEATVSTPDNLTLAAASGFYRAGIAVLTSNLAMTAIDIEEPQTPALPVITATVATVGIANIAVPRTPVSSYVAALDPSQFLASKRAKIGKTNLDNQWRRVRRESVSRIFRREFGRSKQPSLETIEQVNSWVNRKIRYVEDRELFAKADYWAGAKRTLSLGKGDCEDYALTKMQLLAAAGVNRNDMFLTIAKDRVRNADHALLVVKFEGRYLVLDNATDQLMDGALSHDYAPVLSFNSQSAWIHGY